MKQTYPEDNGTPEILNDISENYQLGWIKVWRSLRHKAFYKKSEYVHLWIHLLIQADHSGEVEIMFKGKPYKLKPGEFSTGRKKLAKETGINEHKVHRILLYFEKTEHQIAQRTDHQCRIIAILKWSDYQKMHNVLHNDCTTTAQRLHTKQEQKNSIIKEKNLKDRGSIFTQKSSKTAKQTPAGIARFFFSAYADPTLRNEIFDKFAKKLGDELDRFVDHWTEPTKSGKQQLWETHKTWELGRRIGRWNSNAAKWGRGKSSKPVDRYQSQKDHIKKMMEKIHDK